MIRPRVWGKRPPNPVPDHDIRCATANVCCAKRAQQAVRPAKTQYLGCARSGRNRASSRARVKEWNGGAPGNSAPIADGHEVHL